MNWDWDKLKKQQKSRGGGSGQPPQVDEILDKFKNVKFTGGPVIIIIIIIILFFGSSTFYTVKIDEVGVIQRFGKYVRTTQPGFHLKLPAGIEKVTKVAVKRVLKEEFGFVSIKSETERTRYLTAGEQQSVSLMLTGDLNVALVPWIVQYRIKDPYNFLFKVEISRRVSYMK